MFTLVSKIHENVDLFWESKYFELEGVIDSCEYCFKFLNRSITFFSQEQITFEPKEQNFIVGKAPFLEAMLGMATVKM